MSLCVVALFADTVIILCIYTKTVKSKRPVNFIIIFLPHDTSAIINIMVLVIFSD